MSIQATLLPYRSLQRRERAAKPFRDAALPFSAALFLYATVSTPFPQNPGLIEVVIAGLFAVAVSIPTCLIVAGGGFSLLRRYDVVPLRLHFIFFFFLWWNMLNGFIIKHWELRDIIRDIVPFVYLFMPLFLLPVMSKAKNQWVQLLPWLISAIGVILSIRFYKITGVSLLDLGKSYYQDNLLYIPYDPSVVFASIYLPLMAFHIFELGNFKRMAGSILMLIGGLLALGSLMAVAQRAPLGLACFCFALYVVCYAFRSIKKFLFAITLTAAVISLGFKQLQGSLKLLEAKQQAFGANGKFDEVVAVSHELSSSVPRMLFGLGWGGLFHDPAVNYVAVSYTHSLITYFLLKGGVIGLFIMSIYLLWLLNGFIRSISIDRLPILLGSAVPLIIGLFFQVSYKALTYGMILTLISLIWMQVKASKIRSDTR